MPLPSRRGRMNDDHNDYQGNFVRDTDNLYGCSDCEKEKLASSDTVSDCVYSGNFVRRVNDGRDSRYSVWNFIGLYGYLCVADFNCKCLGGHSFRAEKVEGW